MEIHDLFLELDLLFIVQIAIEDLNFQAMEALGIFMTSGIFLGNVARHK